jgi:hypothetical protein
MPLKTGISRRVAKSRPVCMGLKGVKYSMQVGLISSNYMHK